MTASTSEQTNRSPQSNDPDSDQLDDQEVVIYTVSCPHILHYMIPLVTTIFGIVFLLIGVSAGGWLFYSIGAIVLLLAIWGFRLANRHIHHISQQQTQMPAEPPGITLKIQQNPLQKMTPSVQHDDPAPPV